MAKVSKKGKGKTLYIELSVYEHPAYEPTKNLTISCPARDTRFKTTLSENGLKQFRRYMLKFYNEHVINKP